MGDVIQALLCQVDNAAALNAAGVGAYASMGPPTLPAATLADLALLTVVSPEPVQLRGESILNTLEQFLLKWHPQYCLYVLPDGTIRVRSIFALTPEAVALPAVDGTGADVDWPGLSVDLSGCYTAWQIQGLDIQSATLSTAQGTLWGKGAGPSGSPKSGWTAAQEAAWTILDFLQPKGASDDGALSSVTSTSASVHSDYATAHWVLNFWNGADVQGWIWFFNLSAAGVDIYEIRQITSCTALTAGGSATVTWDAGQPLNSTTYTRYRIVGQATPQSLVSRKFFVREPAGGLTGTATWVGSHLYPRNSKGMPVANNSRVFQVFYPYAFVQWSRTGAYPWFEVPVPVQVDPLDGSIVLAQPAVQLSAGLAGTTSALSVGYPSSTQNGLYYNVQAVVPYNRGGLSARAPASGFAGTAYTKYGLRRTFVQRLDTFNWLGDQPSLVTLANEHLATVKEPTVTGTLNYYELPAGFDEFTPGFCLNISTTDGVTAVDGLDLPVRAASIRWHDSPDPVLYSASLRFNNRRRPFEGDSLYIHPALGRGTFGMHEDVVFGGVPGGVMGMNEYGKMTTASTPMAAAMQGYKGAARSAAEAGPPRGVSAMPGPDAFGMPMGQTPMGEHPMGQDVGSNQIGQAMAGFGASPDFGAPGPSPGWSPGRSGDPSHVMGRPEPRPAGTPAPHRDIQSAMLKKALQAHPDAGKEGGQPAPPTAPRPGGLAERRGRREDDSDPTIKGAD